MESKPDAPIRETNTPEVKRSSPIRLIVLLGILAILFTGLMVDMFYMREAVDAAEKRLVDAHQAIANKSVTEETRGKEFLNKDGVHEAIGFEPTSHDIKDGVLVEQFRWWGPIPLNRRYIVTYYLDEDGNKYDHCEVANGGVEKMPTDYPAPPPGNGAGMGSENPGMSPPIPIPGSSDTPAPVTPPAETPATPPAADTGAEK